uniref:Serine/arginine repetitive matrix protein 1-like n=1 Tax=Callorhinus ursinus TaxID=34884 RepID=A0A3Q7PYM3_CALUR|nr:serine/arginine repetitive matrix protein 1-like [Callorhinus ursinus]
MTASLRACTVLRHTVDCGCGGRGDGGRGAGVSRRQSGPRGEGRGSGERRAPAGTQRRPRTVRLTRSEGSVVVPRDSAPSGVTRPEAPRGRRGDAAGVWVRRGRVCAAVAGFRRVGSSSNHHVRAAPRSRAADLRAAGGAPPRPRRRGRGEDTQGRGPGSASAAAGARCLTAARPRSPGTESEGRVNTDPGTPERIRAQEGETRQPRAQHRGDPASPRTKPRRLHSAPLLRGLLRARTPSAVPAQAASPHLLLRRRVLRSPAPVSVDAAPRPPEVSTAGPEGAGP